MFALMRQNRPAYVAFFIAMWVILIALLLWCIFFSKSWKWRLLFGIQIVLTVFLWIVNFYFNYNNGFSDLGEAFITFAFKHFYGITLFVSWVFWMNRKRT